MNTAISSQEPAWFAARRERAAALSGQLELPQVKGGPGWEFPDLSGLDLDAYPPAEDDGHEIGGVESLLEFSGEADPGDAVVGPLGDAPDAVKRHLGTVVFSEDPFVALNEANQT